jgi:hypothetical protein
MESPIEKEKEILSHLIDAQLLFTELPERLSYDKREWVSHMVVLEKILEKRVCEIIFPEKT